MASLFLLSFTNSFAWFVKLVSHMANTIRVYQNRGDMTIYVYGKCLDNDAAGTKDFLRTAGRDNELFESIFDDISFGGHPPALVCFQ